MSRLKCDTCGTEFLWKTSLREHCRKKHGLTLSGEAINGYRCDCCGNTFASKFRFERHRETVPGRSCTVCGKICDRLSKLLQHMRTHTGEKPFKCSTCGVGFSRSNRLNKHCLGQHGRRVSSNDSVPTAPKRPVRENSYPKCPYCGRVFKRLFLMKRHIKVHTGERPYACDKCGLKFSKKDTLKQHYLRVHTSSDELPTPSGEAALKHQRCSICGKLWWSPSLLKRHMRIHTGEKPYACDACGLKFSMKDTLKQHYFSKHERSTSYKLPTASGKVPVREHKCLICGTLWYTPSKLKEHMVVHTQEKAFPCDVCGDRFACKKYMLKHCVRVHGKPTELHGAGSHGEAATKPQPATEQDRACPKASLKAHQKKKYLDLAASTVSPATNRTCPHCGEFFRYPSAMKQHMTVHGEKQFECEVCHKYFARKDKLKTHLKKIHMDPATSPSEKTFSLNAHQKKHEDLAASGVSPATDRTCPQCGKCFRYPSAMKQHMTVHTGERPFGCDVCNKTFKWKASLNAHQKMVHTDLAAEQDRTCPICGMVFDSPSRMKRHMIQHTGEKPYQCSICVEYFSQAAALEEHHQKMHKKGKERIPAKDRTCKFCDAIFSTIAELVCHSQKECA